MTLTIQLYTVRDQLAADAPGTLAKLKELGIDYVEGGGSFGTGSAKSDRAMLDDLGLKVSGAHIGVDRLEKELDVVIGEMTTLGSPFVIVPWVDKDSIRGDWAAFAKRLSPIGTKLKDAGLTLTYHNHDFEFEDGDGLGVMHAHSGDEVGFELDVMWVHKGGHDPLEVFGRLTPRVPLLHLKDYVPGNSPQWVAAGQGVLDLPAIVKAGDAAGVRFGAIELDQSPNDDPMAAVAESVTYLRGLGLG